MNHDDFLTLIDERSAAFRAAARAADLTARVPGCPDWDVRALVEHLGGVHRYWAAAVAAGGAEPDEDTVPDRAPGPVDLFAWSEASTRTLLDALRKAGPDGPCATWWGESAAPETSGAVARHQVQEAAVHCYDAQEAGGAAQPIPADIAADSIDEFLVVTLGAMQAWVEWPHDPLRFAVATDEGSRWTVDVSAGKVAPADGEGEPAVTLSGSASDVLLAIYSRIPLERIDVSGDRAAAESLLDWASTD